MLVRVFILVTAFVLAAPDAAAGSGSRHDTQSRAALTTLLKEFLYEASYGRRAVHERFWHDDLVYTSSRGTRTDKPSILASMETGDANAEPAQIFSGDNIQITVIEDMAIVAFRLIATPNPDAEVPAEATVYYFNTGTFVFQDSEWRAIAWQATRIPG
ncbi:MAG: nuclear transport factor 2 family protein [Pseudomonadota bacterium]